MKNTKSLRSRVLSVSSVVILLVVLLANTASAAWKTFEFVNRSNQTIRSLYISSSGNNDWGDDLLGRYILEPGDSVSISYNARYRYYDLKVIFAGGKDITCWGHDFRSLWKLTFFWKRGDYYVRSN